MRDLWEFVIDLLPITFRFSCRPWEASRLEAKTHEAEATTHEAEATTHEATTHEAAARFFSLEARFFGLEARPWGLTSLAPGHLSDQCIPASTFAGRANTICAHPRGYTVPRTKTKTLGPRGVLLRLICYVDLAPGRLAWFWTFASFLQKKIEISLFHSWMIFFVYFITVAFFAMCANVMFISWHVQMSELNWTETL